LHEVKVIMNLNIEVYQEPMKGGFLHLILKSLTDLTYCV